ncbi:MAG: diaminopimelate epimerase [Planctomycetes bacterium]|nr:diaminopimelate epimerase [Planctomycetota bacterium]
MTVLVKGSLPKALALDAGSNVYWVNGAGNRFVLVDASQTNDVQLWIDSGPDWARSLVLEAGAWRSKEGGQADGLVFILPAQTSADLRMVLFNVDGSRPEACGNALRCLARVAFDLGLVARTCFVVETDAGERRANALEKNHAESIVSMGAPRLIHGRLSLEVCGRMVTGLSISMGNPHFVVDSNTVSDSEVAHLGAALSIHPQFQDGTNVEFVFGIPDAPRVRVWERGVGETEACGSGACAVAHALYGTALIRRELTLSLTGGSLVVGRDTHGIWLRGGARWESLQLGTPHTTEPRLDR